MAQLLDLSSADKISEKSDNSLKRKFKHQNKNQGVYLYVKNLDESLNDTDLHKMFSPFGRINSAKVISEMGQSKGCGFVCFVSPEEAAKAINEMNGHVILKKPLYVNIYTQRTKISEIKLQQEIEVIPGINDIEEINSVPVKLNENAKSDIISQSLAKYLGCKVKRENDTDQMELVGRKPIAISGITKIMLRLPTSEGKVSNKFIKCMMKVSANLDTEIIISHSTQILLGLLPEKSPHEVRKDYREYRRYQEKKGKKIK